MLLSNLILLAAVGYGVRRFFLKRSALYFRILTLAVSCYALISVFRLLYFLCYDGLFDGMGVTFFGYFGCFLFLLSANYGQYDSLIDDGSRMFRKYRLAALAAPVVMLALLAGYLFGNVGKISGMANVLIGIGYLPVIPAAYFHMKHFMIPDMGFTFVRWIRIVNVCALLAELMELARAYLYAAGNALAAAVLTLLISASFLMMLVFAGKGRKSWLA